MTAFCSIDNVTSYRLDPPRGNVQHALVTLSSVVEGTFVVDQVQHITQQEAEEAKESLQRLLSLAVSLHTPSRKRGGKWTDEFSPLSAKRVKILGRSGSDAPVEKAGA